MFGEIACTSGFESAFGGWFMESHECIAVLDLQKSHYGNHYELNIKIYVKGAFGFAYVKSKELKNDTGDVFRAQPKEYDAALNLEIPMPDEVRKEQVESMFREFVVPYTEMALKRTGIRQLVEEKKAFLLEAVQKELERLGY